MKRHNNGISEEHIVAYLDGELNVNDEMREALGDAELRHVAKEYAVLKKIFSRSSSEARFQLDSASDARALTYLQSVLRGKTTTPMTPDADAIPMARPTVERTKKYWAKRSVIGFALALFLGALWFTFKPSMSVDTPVIVNNAPTEQVQPNPIKAPVATEPAPTVNTPVATTPDVAATTTPAATEKRVSKKQAPVVENTPAPPVETAQNIVANQQEEKPADIMISRRYAKLIKNVRVVEITQQDKM